MENSIICMYRDDKIIKREWEKTGIGGISDSKTSKKVWKLRQVAISTAMLQERNKIDGEKAPAV